MKWLQISILVLLPIILSCGVQEDAFQCRDLCDRKAVCNPSLADPEWDACHADCELNEYSRALVDCVLGLECEGSFDDMIASCYFDPMAAVEPQ